MPPGGATPPRFGGIYGGKGVERPQTNRVDVVFRNIFEKKKTKILISDFGGHVLKGFSNIYGRLKGRLMCLVRFRNDGFDKHQPRQPRLRPQAKAALCVTFGHVQLLAPKRPLSRPLSRNLNLKNQPPLKLHANVPLKPPLSLKGEPP